MGNYEEVGFKAGLEIHQQLDTGKLFCSCPGVLRQDEPLSEVSRRLHLVAGESGKVDIAAKYQHMEDREHVYRTYDTTCLVELDEEPPHPINPEALRVAMEIAILLNCKIIPLTQIMRKTVINGSNTSGFQRTAMVARDGYIETSQGRVGIDALFLEEDSARKVKAEGNRIYWNLDRLGIPLVEIATAPDLKNAAHVKEAAMMLGDILRSCDVRRGIGTIRQDVNISIAGSERVEIKGFQDPKIMEKTVDLEIERQQLYLEWKNGFSSFMSSDIIDVTDVFDVKMDWMKDKIDSGDGFFAFKLEGFHGKIGRQNEVDNYWLGREVAGYAKTRGFGGVIHCDEDFSKYKFSDNEIKKLEDKLRVLDNDGWMMVLGSEMDSRLVINDLIFPFLASLKNGNLKEVRNCLPDGITEFIRPMPGSARMYPETDLNLLKISRDMINKVKKNLPKLRSEIEKELRGQGLTEELVGILFKRNKLPEFREISQVIDDLNLIGKALLLIPKEIAVKEGRSLEEVEEELSVDSIIFVLEKVVTGNLEESDLREVFEKVVSGIDILEAVKIERVDSSKVESRIAELISEKPGLRPNAYMGLLMKEFKGKLSAKDVMPIINKIL